MNDIVNIISSVGFPIAMCLILMYYINTTQKELINKLADIGNALSNLITKVDIRAKEETDDGK